MEYAKFPNRIKDKKRRNTQIADIYNATLDDHRGDTTNAKRAFKSFFTHYGSERFDNVKPLEGYYGFDKKDYEDSTLDSLGKDWHKQMKENKKMKISKKYDGTKGAKSNDNFRDKLSPSKRKEYDEYVQSTKKGLSSDSEKKSSSEIANNPLLLD
jgi:hypothetical protein